MKKFLWFLCMVLALVGCKEEKKVQAEGKPVIKIGVTMPLTGDAAEAGESARAGLEMILEKMKEKSLKYEYQFIFEDNQMNPMKTANNVNKFIFMDKVDAIFSMWNLMSNVVATIASQYDVFSFACSYGTIANTGDYSFNMQNSYQDQAELLVSELQKRNIKTLALFVDNSAIMDQYKVIEDYVKQNSDVEIVFKEYFNPGEKDYRAAIVKAHQKNPDLYMISGYPPSPYLFLRQLREITGKNDNVTSVDSLAEIDSNHRHLADNLWYIDSNQNGLDAFQDELIKNKGLQSQSCVGNVASDLEIFIEAVENAVVNKDEKKPSKENIRQWIMENVKNYPTASGNATVLNDGFIVIKPSVKMIKGGKSISIEE